MTTTLNPTQRRPQHQTADRSPVQPFDRAAVDKRRSLALGLLVSAQFMVMLDTSIVNVALPSIQSDLALGPAGVAWVVNAYVLAFGGLLVLSGRVADLFGRRRMFIGGSALFTLGTLVAAAAANQWMLLGGRVIQGAGAAALSPAAMSLLLLTVPGPARARAMSLWGAASAVGGATGVFLGGLLTGALGWQAVFLVTVPISVSGAVVALVHGALGLAENGVTTSTVVSLGIAAALVGAFITIERRAPEPLVPLDLFGHGVVSTGVVLAAGHLWLAYAPTGAGYTVAVLPGLFLVATGVAFSFTPTTMVIAGAMPDAHAGLASGLAGSATQVGSALGTSVFTAVGIAVAGTAAGTLGSSGFTAAFTAAAVVSLATAGLGCTLVRRPQSLPHTSSNR
jgi:MFS family permease